MDMKIIRRIAGVLALSALMNLGIYAQVRNDVIKAYNAGVQMMKEDVAGAIESFESTITIAEQVGETADDLKSRAMQVLPGLYYQVAYNLLNADAPAQEVLAAARNTRDASEKYGSASNKENAERIMIQVYITMASEFYANKDYENALAAFDSVLMVNPDHFTALYNKALIYRTQDSTEAFEESVDTYISKLDPEADAERLAQASRLAIEYFRAQGSQANADEDLDAALAAFDKASKYGEDKDLFYYYADVYNKQEKFAEAAEYAQRGLDMEEGDAEAKAKFYYQLAVAQAGSGDTASACSSFSNAMYGAFAEASKAQRTNLGCN